MEVPAVVGSRRRIRSLHGVTEYHRGWGAV
jgi:hypothetical protein